ncbi:MAG TPA: hypothetical protein VM324_10485 [Egibacteraceae bacterium]|nr:hypothetical protein [Egibacteraceae bacterium]
MPKIAKKSLVLALCAMAVLAAGVLPAAAQTANAARGYSYGINAALGGSALLDQTPNCTAEIPPEAEAFCREVLVDVPVEGVLESGTLVAENQVNAAGGLSGRLQEERVDFTGPGVIPDAFNVASYAVTEELAVVDTLLQAEVVEAEAVASCVGGQPVFATGANVANLRLAETEVLAPLLDALEIDLSPVLNLTQAPNTLVVDLSPVIRVVFWETNWDGRTGTTDGSNTVFVNALRIQVLTGVGDGGGLIPLPDILGDLLNLEPPAGSDVQVQQQETGTVDIIVSHAEASVTNCAAGPQGPGGPLDGITKTASSDVVFPGDTFTYTIDVPNQSPTCTLTNVRVVDTITGPPGSTITSTTPQADNVDGLTVTYNDVGPIGPGQSVRLTIGVRVPDNAPAGSTYAEQLRVTADCDGQPVQGGLDFTGPRVGERPAPAGPAGPGQLPRTGGAFPLAGLAFMAFGAGLLRLRG